MNSLVHKQHYQSLMERFLTQRLSLQDFCDAVFDLREKEEVTYHTLRAGWAEPLQQLHQAGIERRLSHAEYEQKRAELLGYAEDIPFQKLIWDLETVCHWFTAKTETVSQAGAEQEDELRAEVTRLLRQYEQAKPSSLV